MKTKPQEGVRGGFREGSGRKPLHEDGATTCILSVRIRADQKAKVEALGGSEWIRQVIDLYPMPGGKK